MTLIEMRHRVIYQSNNDRDDLGDFEPHLDDYINDGYDQLIRVWAGEHTAYNSENYPKLAADMDVPITPEWTHPYIADWATWLVYRNGHQQKQQRGYPFRESFESMLRRVAEDGGQAGLNADGTQKKYKKFRNIPY